MLKRTAWALVQCIGVFPFLCIAGLAAGLALAPAIYCFDVLQTRAAGLSPFLYYPACGIALVLGYFVYGLSLIFVAPALNFVLGGRLKPWRGKAISFGCVPWYIHASLTLVVRLSFLEFVTPTPFNIIFYRLMGMKIGRDVTINSTAIADPSLIELADRVTVGGSASIMAHYAQGGFIVIAPVKIGAGVTLGLRSIVMGGCEIGEKAKIMAGSFVLPNTKIPAGETWGGIPAIKVDVFKHRTSEA